MEFEHLGVLLSNNVEQQLLQALVQLHMEVPGIACFLHHLSLFGGWAELPISLDLNIKRLEARNHLLVHNVVFKALVIEGVHRDAEQLRFLDRARIEVALIVRGRSRDGCFFVSTGFVVRAGLVCC